jgi:hypothetical protein
MLGSNGETEAKMPEVFARESATRAGRCRARAHPALWQTWRLGPTRTAFGSATRRLRIVACETRSDPQAEVLVGHRTLASKLGVSPRMILAWVSTGAWPLPRQVHKRDLFYLWSDAEQWLRTGRWPADAWFRTRPV